MRVIKEEVPIVVFSPERLRFLIYDHDFEHSLPDYLRKTKDIVVIGCTVGLRFNDLIHITRKNLLHQNGTTYLQLKAQKTGIRTSIKLPPYVLEIWNGKPKSQPLMPAISNNRLNLNIKELCHKAGWTEPVEKVRTQDGEPKSLSKKGKPYRFCDLVSTHTMRRTAITTLLLLGMPEIMVRRISGHSDNSTSFYRYVHFAQQFQDQEIDKVYEKMNPLES